MTDQATPQIAENKGALGGPKPGIGPKAPIMIVRRKPKANPLVQRNNGIRKPVRVVKPKPEVRAAQISASGIDLHRPTQPDAQESGQPPGTYRDIPLFMTKKSLLQGLRFHVMRLHSDHPIDPTDQEEWTRPIRLHRRDPRYTGKDNNAGREANSAEAAENEREKKRLEGIKAERKRVRDENQAQIAPTQRNQKHLSFHRKFEQVFNASDTPEALEKAKLRYEGSQPWHLEDFDGNQVWTGSFVSELSNKNILFLKDTGPGPNSVRIRIVPLEKWYRFRAKTKFRFLTADEAEAHMGKKFKDPRWFMAAQRAADEAMMAERTKNAARGRLFKIKGGSRPGAGAEDLGHKEEVPSGNIDDMDFDEKEEFADDDEGDLFESYDMEAAKLAAKRVRKEQYEANVFGLADEKEVDSEEVRERKKRELQRQLEKSTRKVLIHKEKNIDYMTSDEESNPYASSSEGSADSEAEAREKTEPAAKAVGSSTNTNPAGVKPVPKGKGVVGGVGSK